MKMGGRSRLRLTNGYFVQFEQIARMLSAACVDSRARIPPRDLASQVGVSDNHAEFLCHIAHALGLLALVSYRPTPVGRAVHANDLFCDDIGTLWLLHYIAASDPQNLAWNRFANEWVREQGCFTRDDFKACFVSLRGQFSSETYTAYVNKETRSLLDAYTNQNFARLAYVQRESDTTYRLSYREPVPPCVLAACIAHYRDKHRPGDTAISITDLLSAPNSPGLICQIPEDRFRTGLEALKAESGFSLESRADLDQVRLTDKTQDYEWMERYYAGR